jgi:hypothetical protein
MEKLKEQQNAKQEAHPLKWPTNLDAGKRRVYGSLMGDGRYDRGEPWVRIIDCGLPTRSKGAEVCTEEESTLAGEI